MISHVPESACPVCSRRLDAVTHDPVNPTISRPRAGDYTICRYCSAWLIFDHDLQVRLMTDADSLARLTILGEGLTYPTV